MILRFKSKEWKQITRKEFDDLSETQEHDVAIFISYYYSKEEASYFKKVEVTE